MLIGALRLPDANGENLVCGNLYHLSAALHQFPMLIGALRLPDANGENLVCGNLYHLGAADLKDFAVK